MIAKQRPFILHDELISGRDVVKCSAGESGTVRLLLGCDPDLTQQSAQQGQEGCREQDGQVSPVYRRPD